MPPGDGALGRFLSPYPGAKEERNSKEQRAKANHWGYTECPDPSMVCIYVGDGVGMHMEYVLEEIVGGRTGLAGSDSVPYVLDEVRVGGDMSGVPLGVPGVLTGGLFEEMVLEDARERLMSQYGASGVGGLVAAWRGPVIGGGRRGRMDGTGEELKGEMQSVNHVYCVSVHGEMRRELRLWRLACGDDGVQCCHVVSHEVPVEAVCASHTGEGAEEGAQSGESAVLVAVRSISSVVYYRVLYEKSKRGRGAGGRLVRLEGGVGAGGHGTGGRGTGGDGAWDGSGDGARLRDFSWSQFSSPGLRDGIVLDDAGMLREVRAVISPATSVISSASRSYDGECVVDAYGREQRQRLHHLGTRRCVASPLHPRLNLVAWEGVVVRVDFREKQQDRARVACDVAGERMGSFVTALAVPSRVGQSGRCDLRRFAISTSSHVHLYDMRRTKEPVVSWEHYMKYPREDMNTSTSRPPKWDMQTCFPDGLHFLDDALLVTNSVLGKGMACSWRVVEPAPRIGFDGGAQRWLEREQGIDAGDMAPGDQGDNLQFTWRPVSLERLEAIEPPRLLYSDYYPEPAMPALIERQTSKLIEIQYGRECVDGSGGLVRKRVLPAKNPPVVRRDFGQTVVGSTLIRYGTFGEILVGRISRFDASDRSDASDAAGRRRGSDAGGRDGPRIAREVEVAVGSPSERISVPSNHVPNTAQIAEETDHACPIHDWLIERAQHEILSGATDGLPLGGIETVIIDGLAAAQLRSLLLHLIERLEGTPISAYEAWDILQKHATAQNPQHASQIVEDEIRLFRNLTDAKRNGGGGGGGGGRRAERDRGQGSRHANAHGLTRSNGSASASASAVDAGIDGNGVPECHPGSILASHLRSKHLLPILMKEWTSREENQPGVVAPGRARRGRNERERREEPQQEYPGDARTLTPSRAFLTVWESLDQMDGVLSRRDRDPRAVQRSIEQLAALDLHKVGSETGERGRTDDEEIDRVPRVESTVVKAASSFKAWAHPGQSDARHPVLYVRDEPAASEKARRKLEDLRKRHGRMPSGGF